MDEKCWVCGSKIDSKVCRFCHSEELSIFDKSTDKKRIKKFDERMKICIDAAYRILFGLGD